VGDSGGRGSKTNTVIRMAKTPSENMLSRSGVALAWSTVVPLAVRCPRVRHYKIFGTSKGISAARRKKAHP
jgi:hypothetical protein